MSEENPIEAAIKYYWGERCSENEPECPVCDAWALYDTLVENSRNRAESSPQGEIEGI